MDTWRAITEDDLLTVLSGAELEAYRAAALASGQDDPVAAVISAAVGECRGRIAAHAANRLADGETIPAALLPHVLVLARQRIFTRLPVRVTDARQREEERTDAYLRDVARGLVAIEQPDVPAAVQPAAAMRPSFSPRVRTNGE